MNGALELASRLIIATEFWAGITGAIVGAVIGGIIAYLVQRQALAEARKQRSDDKLDRQQGLATSLLVKIIKIYSTVNELNQHIEASLSAPYARDREAWQVVKPLASIPELVSFSPDEIGVLLWYANPDTVQLVMDLDVRHNNVLAITHVFNTRRSDLSERITALGEVEMAGHVASVPRDDPRVRNLRPMMVDVNTLVDGLRGILPLVSADASRGFELVQKAFKPRLKLPYQFELLKNPP